MSNARNRVWDYFYSHLRYTDVDRILPGSAAGLSKVSGKLLEIPRALFLQVKQKLFLMLNQLHQNT